MEKSWYIVGTQNNLHCDSVLWLPPPPPLLPAQVTREPDIKEAAGGQEKLPRGGDIYAKTGPVSGLQGGETIPGNGVVNAKVLRGRLRGGVRSMAAGGAGAGPQGGVLLREGRWAYPETTERGFLGVFIWSQVQFLYQAFPQSPRS